MKLRKAPHAPLGRGAWASSQEETLGKSRAETTTFVKEREIKKARMMMGLIFMFG